MKYDLSKIGLKNDLEWLKTPNNALNDYSNVIRHLLNEVEELKQLSIPIVSKRSELLRFLEWHYSDVGCNQEQRETIIDQYLKQ